MKQIIILIVLITLTVPLSLASGLEITEIDVHVEYDEAYTYRVENRDRIDSTTVSPTNGTSLGVDILPGSNVTFTLRIENTFQGEEPDLRGVFATMIIEDIDDGADLEEESTDFDLEPGDDYRVDVKFAVPLDVDSGTYNVVMEIEGEDRNETSYRTKLVQKLEVKKQSHDIRITNVLLSPGSVACDRKAKLTAEIANAGSNPESQIALEFISANLGINSFDSDIFLESSDEASADEKTYTKTLNFEVPSFFQSGKFPILINLYWKNFVLFDQKTAELTVTGCETQAVSEKEVPQPGKTEKVEVIQVEIPEEGAETENVVTATTEVPVSGYIPLMLGGFIITVLAVLIVAGYLRRRA